MYRILQLKFTAIRGVEVGVKCVRFQSRVRRYILSMCPEVYTEVLLDLARQQI